MLSLSTVKHIRIPNPSIGETFLYKAVWVAARMSCSSSGGVFRQVLALLGLLAQGKLLGTALTGAKFPLAGIVVDGWLAGWLDGYMDGCTGRWTDG